MTDTPRPADIREILDILHGEQEPGNHAENDYASGWHAALAAVRSSVTAAGLLREADDSALTWEWGVRDERGHVIWSGTASPAHERRARNAAEISPTLTVIRRRNVGPWQVAP